MVNSCKPCLNFLSTPTNFMLYSRIEENGNVHVCIITYEHYSFEINTG